MQDPVCGMTVEPQHAAGTEIYNGVTYALLQLSLPGEVSR